MDKVKTLYIDMDDTLCDYMSAYNLQRRNKPEQAYPQAEYGFFAKLMPILGSYGALNQLDTKYNIWIVTRPSIQNPFSYLEKRTWVENRLGMKWVERLNFCPNKSILDATEATLIDDQPWRDCPEHPERQFKGRQILFGSKQFPDWGTVVKELM